MADKEKKYFWLKLPRNFFGKHYIKILRDKQNEEYPGKTFGELLVALYIWLLTECIDHEGRLRYSETTPYDAELLAAASGYPLQFVTQALQIFTKLELVVTESDGTLFLPKSLKMIGSESASAKRVREYRQRQEEAKNNQQTPENTENSDNRYNVTQRNNMKQNGNTEKELEKEIDKDNKKDNVGEKPTPPYKEIIDYLNLKTNSHYKHTTKATQRIINGRYSDGATLDDFKAVIDIKSAQWIGDKKMAAFLRPETLFAANHFESYLNEASHSDPPEKKHSGIGDSLAKETDKNISGSNEYGEFN